jgi:hypothetical protein
MDISIKFYRAARCAAHSSDKNKNVAMMGHPIPLFYFLFTIGYSLFLFSSTASYRRGRHP